MKRVILSQVTGLNSSVKALPVRDQGTSTSFTPCSERFFRGKEAWMSQWCSKYFNYRQFFSWKCSVGHSLPLTSQAWLAPSPSLFSRCSAFGYLTASNR